MVTKIFITVGFFYISFYLMLMTMFDSTGEIEKLSILSFCIFILFLISFKFEKIYKFVLMLVIAIVIYPYPHNRDENKFSIETWNRYPQKRFYLVESLDSQYGLVGKSEQFIIYLIGQPDYQSDSYENSIENYYTTYTYYIGTDERRVFLIIDFTNSISVKFFIREEGLKNVN